MEPAIVDRKEQMMMDGREFLKGIGENGGFYRPHAIVPERGKFNSSGAESRADPTFPPAPRNKNAFARS